MTGVQKYRIEAPVRSFSGESVGVKFDKGTGFVDDSTKGGRAALEYFRRHGYGVSPVEDEKTDEDRVQELVASVPTQPVAIPPAEPFDPAQHGVEDVLAHLGEADHDEAVRVLDAEASAKKPRSSKREDLLTSKTPAAPAGDDQKGAGQ